MTGKINLAHINRYVDEIAVIPESSIRSAWRDLLDLSKLAAEPAAATSLAAIREGAIDIGGAKQICMIMSGGNADFANLDT